MDADVIIKFRFNNVCSKQDLEDTRMSFKEMVELLIQECGLFGVCEDEYEIIEVKEVK